MKWQERKRYGCICAKKKVLNWFLDISLSDISNIKYLIHIYIIQHRQFFIKNGTAGANSGLWVCQRPISVQHTNLEMRDQHKDTEIEREKGKKDTKQRGRLDTLIILEQGEGVNIVNDVEELGTAKWIMFMSPAAWAYSSIAVVKIL